MSHFAFVGLLLGFMPLVKTSRFPFCLFSNFKAEVRFKMGFSPKRPATLKISDMQP